MKWSFWGEWCFFTKFWKFYTKSNIFNNILHKTFVFYCRHLLLNNELSVFVFVIVMDKSRFCTLRWTFRPSFGLLLKLGAPKNKIENILFAWNFHIILHNNLILNFWRKSCNSCVFLNHKAIPGTFPSWLKAALGKQGIYLLLSVGITRNLSQKHQQISPIFFHSFPVFISLYGYFARKTYIFMKAWPMYYNVKANIGWIVTCVLPIIFRHIWPQNMRPILNTVIYYIIFI